MEIKRGMKVRVTWGTYEGIVGIVTSVRTHKFKPNTKSLTVYEEDTKRTYDKYITSNVVEVIE